jgi:hypothetical protein
MEPSQIQSFGGHEQFYNTKGFMALTWAKFRVDLSVSPSQAAFIGDTDDWER